MFLKKTSLDKGLLGIAKEYEICYANELNIKY